MISLKEVEIGEYVDAHNDLDLGPLSLYTYIYIDDFHSPREYMVFTQLKGLYMKTN